ncbi:hypothetical protein M0R04_05470 [Candidatus Dojkabacteria bacterium]|nr:hypothetical protein [Candidatus Dojkabacteria bacterium]
MIFIILDLSFGEITILTDFEGKVLMYDKEEEAKAYVGATIDQNGAEENLHKYKIVEIMSCLI